MSSGRAAQYQKLRKKKSNAAKQQRVLKNYADAVVTPASQVAQLIPGTYRTTNLWAMGLKGSGESKFFDEVDNGQFINDQWSIQSFVNIPGGNGAAQREGREVLVTNFHIQGWLPGNPNFTIYHRVVVLIDKQANGALPNASDVFVTTDTLGPTALGQLNAYRNLDEITRFEILYDKKFAVKPAISGATDPEQRYFKVSRKKAIKIEWSGQTGQNNTIRSNNLVMMRYCYGATGGPSPSTQPVQFRHVMRVRYLDN